MRPTRFLQACLLIAFSLILYSSNKSPAAESEPTANRFSANVLGFVKTHCASCHGDSESKGEINLEADVEAPAIVKHRLSWERASEVVASGQMPPSDKPRPNQAEIDQFVAVIGAIFDEADLNAKPDPGRVTVRRLNRTEYNNTVRDLMLVDFDAAEDFPSDDIGHGFDNIGDVLTMSPILMERYLSAAESIVNRAILVGAPPPSPKRQAVATFLKTTNKDEAFEVPHRMLETSGRITMKYKIPVDGEYIFRIRGWGRQVGDQPVKVSLYVDDNVMEIIDFTATEKEKGGHDLKPVFLAKGSHKVAVTFDNEFTDSSGEKPVKRALFIQLFELEGPLDMFPPSHKRLLACQTDKSKTEQAREIVTRFLGRTYRRSATAEEIERHVALVQRGLDEGLSWEAAFRQTFLTALVSPKFLFRLELDDRAESPEARPLNEYQLASRMSYFIWSSMPDDELFRLAADGQLTNNLEAQVRRMLADPKANSLVDNFAMQWLQLKRLKTVSPDAKLFPAFNESLRAAMLKETELFVETVIHEDRSINDLLDADFTFVNKELAQLYGLDEVYAKRIGEATSKKRGPEDDFVRVELLDKTRGGLLTQASILTVTSNPTRTSPVKRGRWILEQVLGAPPPPPPPNVPELPEGETAQLTGSLRQRMEQHRSNPACAICHTTMDQLGFAFENYNAIGGFRTKDGDFPIEPGGTLPDGKSFQGPIELKAILKEQRGKVGRNLIQKLMIYGLGRGLEPYDRRPVTKIQEALNQNEGKFSTLVVEIVKSDPFRMRRGSD